MYVNTSAEVKAETDYCCMSANAVEVVEHVRPEHGEDVEILFGPDMWLGTYVERVTGRPMVVWPGECHGHAGMKLDDINRMRGERPGSEFLFHPSAYAPRRASRRRFHHRDRDRDAASVAQGSPIERMVAIG